ncbi:hypothetical protein CEXT_644511 [Caerostris extrusa]|uniref:Uncharacterized protein n=1 Tax=Caerostris extrusa TaxID=172846 RepID=A0AAV4VEC6_CAEEX|nr:hypothetical protein CEXT_644511 [Caerostris extrusa]
MDQIPPSLLCSDLLRHTVCLPPKDEMLNPEPGSWVLKLRDMLSSVGMFNYEVLYRGRETLYVPLCVPCPPYAIFLCLSPFHYFPLPLRRFA